MSYMDRGDQEVPFWLLFIWIPSTLPNAAAVEQLGALVVVIHCSLFIIKNPQAQYISKNEYGSIQLYVIIQPIGSTNTKQADSKGCCL